MIQDNEPVWRGFFLDGDGMSWGHCNWQEREIYGGEGTGYPDFIMNFFDWISEESPTFCYLRVSGVK